MTDLVALVVRHVTRAARFALTIGCLLGGALAALAAPTSAAVVDPYTTNFSSTENPISESGVWLNGKTDGLDWHDVRTTSGLAFGTQDGTVGGTLAYADSTAILNGTFGPDQEASGTVMNNDSGGDWNAEVAVRLRSTMTPHSSTGYEIGFRARRDATAYCGITRWNGALGSFTSFVAGSQCAIKTGDVIRATMIGSTITAYRNGIQVFQGSDTTYTSGNPGMGFFLRNLTQVGNSANYGFSSFTASTIGSGGTPTSTPTPTNTATSTPTPTATPTAGAAVNAYATIQAESFGAKSAGPMAETTTDAGGGQDMGFIHNADWLQFNNVNFGTTAATQFIARVAAKAPGVTGQVEVHLDSLTNPTIGSLAVGDTGGWQNWQTGSATIGATTGTHTVFLKFTTASTGYLVNVNWFNFSTSASPSPTPTPTPTVGAGAPSATFLAQDMTTWGNWKGAYGTNGYWLEADGQSLPSYAHVAFSSAPVFTWSGSTTDTRALQKSGSATDRLAATWYSGSVFLVDLNLTDTQTHKFSVYGVDWDSTSRVQTIDILNGTTGALLDSRSLSGAHDGAYLSWNVTGHLTLRLTRMSGSNVVVSGLFFD